MMGTGGHKAISDCVPNAIAEFMASEVKQLWGSWYPMSENKAPIPNLEVGPGSAYLVLGY
ncbi:MAG TPA: hypothetical protein V6C97_07625 [Oculatellaceae cyanobacterium]